MAKAKSKVKQKIFHFSLGDSSVGPIGFCASVQAGSKQEAVRRLHDSVSCEHELDITGGNFREYITVYFNTDKITVKDIDEVSDLQDEA